MKRFDDLLRMLSSILLGLLIKDAQKLYAELSTYLQACGASANRAESVGLTIAVLIIAGFFRNIHGSSQYDELLENTGSHFRPCYEKCLAGRIFCFLATLAALIVGPLCALAIEWGILKGAKPTVFLILLFLPYIIYFCYDFILVVSLHEKSPIRHPALGWLKLNSILVLFFLIYLLHVVKAGAVGGSISLHPGVIACAFIACAFIQILGDYSLNRHFYFPA